MTSIFNTYYSRNIDRLNASFDGQSKERTEQSGSGSKEFAQVLADVEHPKERAHAAPDPKQPAHAPPVFHESARSMLTNIPSEIVAPQGLPQPGFDIRPSAPPPNVGMRQESRLQPHLDAPPVKPEQNLTPIDGSGLQNVKLEPHRVNPSPASPPKLAPERSAPPPPNAPAPPQMPQIREYARKMEGLDGPLSPPGAPTVASLRRFEVMPRGPQVALRTPQGRGTAPATPEPAIKDIVTTAGRFYGIDPNLGLAVAQVESSFDTDAVSHDGHSSKGLFQLLDSTGKRMHRSAGIEEKYDPFDPAQNAYLGMAYLRHLHDIFSSETKLTAHMRTIPAGSAEHVEKLAVAAYNAGEGSVARAQAKAQSVGKDPSDYDAIEPYLPASTQRYVQRVTSIRDNLALAAETQESAKV